MELGEHAAEGRVVAAAPQVEMLQQDECLAALHAEVENLRNADVRAQGFEALGFGFEGASPRGGAFLQEPAHS
jgi:hypothetical protein